MQHSCICILPCLAFSSFFFFVNCKLSSLTDTSCFADQVSLGWQALLRIAELCHGHAGPRQPGERDRQAITSEAASHENRPPVQILGFCTNKSDALQLNVSFGRAQTARA